MRRSPLTPNPASLSPAQLARNSTLPVSREVVWQRSPLRPVSAKRAAENRERTKVLAEMRREAPLCAMGCGRPGVDGHELLRRSAGGSITNKANIRLLCREHHIYVTEHPAWALANGWQISRFSNAT